MLKGYTDDYKVGFVDSSGTYFVKVYKGYYDMSAVVNKALQYSVFGEHDNDIEIVSMERIPKVSEIS